MDFMHYVNIKLLSATYNPFILGLLVLAKYL